MNVRSVLLASIAAASLGAIPAAALAAVDAFIWFDSVKGDSHAVGHEGAFEIKDFSFGVENPTTIGSATGGAGVGKAQFHEFKITKHRDAASDRLFQEAIQTHHPFRLVTLEMRKAGGSAAGTGVEYLKYTFGTVYTTKIDWSGPGDEGPEESITFVYGTMQVQHLPQGGGTQDWGGRTPAATNAANPWQ